MAEETRATSRVNPTLSRVKPVTEGFIRAIRETVSQGPAIDNLNPPPKARRALIRNTTPGGNTIRLNFGTNPVPQYWNLKTIDQPIEISIDHNTILNVKCMGDVGELQIIYQG